MKKLFVIALALTTFTVNAQDKKDSKREDRMAMKKEHINKMNAADMAEIQTKKMVLALDLTDAQQKQVEKLNLENAKLRIEGMKKRMTAFEKKEKPSHEERMKIQNKKLDQMIATKKEMKRILDAKQYEKWSEQLEKRQMRGKRKKMTKKKAMMKKKRGHDRERRPEQRED